MRATIYSLIFIMFPFLGICAADECTKTSKCGKGPNGYRDIYESHHNGLHSLICEDPGYDDCEWAEAPPSSAGGQYLDQVEDDVVDQINLGNLSGVGVIGNFDYTWTATSSTCYEFEICSQD